ncbi:MAG: M24 family metallopeptidase [Candidatus Promineifilaceae bacterium]
MNNQYLRLPLRKQADVENAWLSERLETLLPMLMERAGLDMWLVIAREYNEDPVIMTLLPQPAMAARRRTILLFHRQSDGTVERFQVSRYGHSGYFETVWKPEVETQYDCLARLVRERDPQQIGINVSKMTAFADGLSHAEYGLLAEALGDYAGRLTSAEELAVGWLEARIESEMVAYSHAVAMGHDIIARAFSAEVIHPGITTTEDVIWWMRQTMHDLGLRAWFQPSITIQAADVSNDALFASDKQRKLIMPGDLLHCDMGFYYLGLATDQQQHCYILKAGETDAPAGLRDALAVGNQLQDLHIAQFAAGKTGNEVLHDTLNVMREASINGMIYSHPLGYHGHAAGAIIGMWDQQNGVPGLGDMQLHDNTCFSIELNVSVDVPEWGQTVRIALEEDAVLRTNQIEWLHGRQKKFHLVG